MTKPITFGYTFYDNGYDLSMSLGLRHHLVYVIQLLTVTIFSPGLHWQEMSSQPMFVLHQNMQLHILLRCWEVQQVASPRNQTTLWITLKINKKNQTSQRPQVVNKI